MSPDLVFFGYGELAVAGLEVLDSAGARIAGVVVPGNRAGLDIEMVRAAASRRSLPVLVQPPRSRVAPFVETLRAIDPRVMIVWSYSMLLPPAVLAVPAHGAVNLHGGPLPEYRGGHVAQWAILNDEPEFGVALHYLDEGVDTGPVIDEQRFPLDRDEDALSIRGKIKAAGSGLLVRWWPRLLDGSAPRRPQDNSRARHWPMRAVEDGRIGWTMSAEHIERLVRALRGNTPGAFVDVAGHRVSIRQAAAQPAMSATAQPGEVVDRGGSCVRVATGAGDLAIRLAEIEGAAIDPGALAALMACEGSDT